MRGPGAPTRRSSCRFNGCGRSYTDLDMEFHFAVAAASKNRLLRELLVPLRGMILEWMAKSHQLPGKRENALKEHRRITEAIRRHDPERAKNAMETHLLTFRHVYTVLGKMSSPHAAEAAADG
ncbi:MAG TPA: FCD domain-containing protein [Bryobacteraceae bacterium]|nr:FCD domain-containing protein [Bryobacteraceae bacterium]